MSDTETTTTTTTETTEYVIPEAVVDSIIERIAKRVVEMLAEKSRPISIVIGDEFAADSPHARQERAAASIEAARKSNVEWG